VTGTNDSPATGPGDRPIVGDHEATLCHRGIFTIDDPLPSQARRPSITYGPVRGRVWSASEGIYRSIFLEGDRGVLCFDTFSSPGAAVAYRRAIGRAFPGKPIHTLVYSHDHLDHTGYALDLAPDAEVIAHAECARVIDLRQSDGQKSATETWSGERAEYEIDGLRFELINPGPTHGNGNIAAYFPDLRLIFMVDTVAPGVGYAFFPDWHMASFVATMRRLESLDWDLFIPGHFWPIDRHGFEESLGYHEFILDAGERALEDGVDPADYPQIARYADDRYRKTHDQAFRYHEYFPLNLMRAMLHARTGGWGLEDTPGAPAGGPPSPDAGPQAGTRRGIGRPSASAPRIEVDQLAPGLWTAIDGDQRTAFAEADDSVIALNTFGSPEGARAYRQAIEATVPGKHIGAIVLTIDHLDHAGFAADLAPGAEIIAHQLCARVIAGRGSAGQPNPTRVVRGDGEALEVDGLSVELRYPGPTLGSGNLAAYLPSHGTLFCVGPRADARYGLFPDWHVEHYAASIRDLLELPFHTFVPGGGPVLERDGVARAIAYFVSLQRTTQKAFAEGVAIWDLRAMEEYAVELMRGAFGALDGFADNVGVGALRVVHHYLMGGWGLEDTRQPDSLLEP
jgi:glyoxylase-like metal-dependent hydrolase (beta-lactamase superfamily II)